MKNASESTTAETLSRSLKAKELWDRTPTSDLAALNQVSSIWSLTAQAEKAEADLLGAKRAIREERVRFWVPVISSLVLVGTLIFQVFQFNENTRLQREAAEDLQFRDAIKTIQSPEMLNAVVGFPILESFFSSPRYKSQVRKVAIGLFPGMTSYDVFETLFEPIKAQTDWSNYRDVVKIDAALWESYSNWNSRIADIEKNANSRNRNHSIPSPDSGLGPLLSPGAGSMSQPPFPQFGGTDGNSPRPISLEEARHVRDEVRKELDSCADFVASLLHRKHPAIEINLSDAYVGNQDLTGVDLRGAILTRSSFGWSNLEGVDLGGVTSFEDSQWSGTAWWHAKTISPALLAYLETQYPYSATEQYSAKDISEADYRAQRIRLDALAKSPR